LLEWFKEFYWLKKTEAVKMSAIKVRKSPGPQAESKLEFEFSKSP